MSTHIGAEMLRKAANVIEERQKAYGPPNQNFKTIASLWTPWLVGRYGEVATIHLDEVDVAVMCDLIKTARLAETPDHEDSWVDKAGYAACGRQVSAKEEIGERTEPSLPTATIFHEYGCALFKGGECDCLRRVSK